jgi:hypothetical protein
VIRKRFPSVQIVAVFLPGILLPADLTLPIVAAENAVGSFQAAVQLCRGAPRAQGS